MFRAVLNQIKIFPLILMPCFAQAATFTVNDSGIVGDANPGDGICEITAATGDCSLAAAIDEANALGGARTINFDASVSLIIPLVAYDLSSADITIQGPGRDLLTLLANGFGILENDSISGITLIHGGGVATLANNATISDSKIYIPANSTSVLVKNGTGSTTIDSSELIGSSSSPAAMITTDVGGTLIVSNSTLRDHTDSSAIVANGTLTVNNSTFTNNRGGASVIQGNTSAVVIAGSHFTNNVVSTATVHATSNTASMDLSGSVFADNALSGGNVNVDAAAIYFASNAGTLTLSRSLFTGNISPDARGIIYSEGTDVFTNVTISDN